MSVFHVFGTEGHGVLSGVWGDEEEVKELEGDGGEKGEGGLVGK